MDQFIRVLQEKRAQAWEQAKGIMSEAAAEGRDVTAEEQETLARIDADIDGLAARIKEVEDRAARAVAADAIREKAAPVLAAEKRPVTDDSIVRSVLRSGTPYEVRALTTSTNTVAQAFYDEVIKYARTLSPVMAISRVLRTSNGENITVPRLTADPSTAGIVSQGSSITPADPTISSVTLGAYGYKHISLWSRELAEDEAVGLDSLVANSAGRDIGLQAGAHFTTGTDSGQPNGYITAASSGKTGTASGYFNSDDILDFYFSLAAPYRAVGVWTMASTALQKVRKMKDGANAYLFTIGVGQPDSLMGRPVYEDPGLAAVGANSKSVAFGDFDKYFIRDAGLRVERSNEAYFATDQTAIKVVWRLDGDLIDTAAVKFLTSAAT